MVFLAEPNHMVTDKRTRKRYYFDAQGRFETEDEYLIRKMSIYFQIEEEKKITSKVKGGKLS